MLEESVINALRPCFLEAILPFEFPANVAGVSLTAQIVVRELPRAVAAAACCCLDDVGKTDHNAGPVAIKFRRFQKPVGFK